MQTETLRRYGAYAAIVVAALASIATSSNDWALHDAAKSLSDTLSTAQPQATHHFTVESSQSHTVRLNGTISWDVNPSAIWQITIQKDDDSAPAVATVIAGNARDLGDGLRESTTLSLGMFQECTESPCKQGYTVTFQLTQATPIEQTKINFAFDASIEGGGEQPKDATVSVTEDTGT
jgi:hypothetical protein